MKKILVVGAGSGIGKSLFDLLKKNKSIQVVGISRRGKNFSVLKKFEFNTNYKCNLLNENEIIDFHKFYTKFNSSIDSIYFCHGSGLFSKLENISSESILEHFSLNVFSIFTLSKLFLKHLKNSNNNPFVCFISSTAGKIGFPESTMYCASKHAVAGFAKSLREEWKKEKIRVFTVYPGAISTSIWDNRQEFSKEDMISPSEFAKYMASFIDLPKSIVVEESLVLPMKGIL